MTHRFRIEITAEAFRHARAGSQMELVGQVPPTMRIKSWWQIDIERVVYEGNHDGTPEDIAVIHRLVTASKSGNPNYPQGGA